MTHGALRIRSPYRWRRTAGRKSGRRPRHRSAGSAAIAPAGSPAILAGGRLRPGGAPAVRPHRAGSAAFMGIRRIVGRRLVRPVRADADRAANDFIERPAKRFLFAGGAAVAGDAADRVALARTGAGDGYRTRAKRARSDPGSIYLSPVPAAGGRLFRVRLP